MDVRLAKRETFERNALDGIRVADTDMNFEQMRQIYESKQIDNVEYRAEQLKLHYI